MFCEIKIYIDLTFDEFDSMIRDFIHLDLYFLKGYVLIVFQFNLKNCARY